MNEDIFEAQINAIKCWCYWMSNWGNPFEWIAEIWGDGVDGKHFFDKFTCECKCDMGRFYRELSEPNQRKLSEYVLKNYRP